MSMNEENQDFELRFRYSNSIIQLIVFNANYDIRIPSSQPIPGSAKGSSFIIDSKRGILLTNAHVVEDIISVKGLSPKLGHDLRMRLISICREKDLAIVQIFKEDWDILVGNSDPQMMELQFEDTLNMTAMTRVVAVGYPLGQDNIKFTPGAVAGFETLGNDSSAKDEDDDGETTSYIQTTAPTNPGNSGGPLINERTGKVVGVISAGIPFAQSVGYAVSTRTVWSCLDALMAPIIHMEEPPFYAKIQSSLIPKGGYTPLDITRQKIKTTSITLGSFNDDGVLPNVIRPPQIGFTYCRSSDDLCNYYANRTSELLNSIEGIYITKVFKNSVFRYLKEGVILSSFICQTSDNEILYGKFDNSGKVTCFQYIYKSSPRNIDIFEEFKNSERRESLFDITNVERKLSFRELIDMVPLGANITWNFIGEAESKQQQKSWGRWDVYSKYSPSKNFIPAQYRFLHFEPLDFEIFGGLCVADLCMNHKIMLSETQQKYLKGDYKFKRHVIVTFVFSDTSANETRGIVMGDILRSINGVEINTIEDVREVLSRLKDDDLLLIKSATGGIVAIPISKARLQDQSAIAAYQITNYTYKL